MEVRPSVVEVSAFNGCEFLCMYVYRKIQMRKKSAWAGERERERKGGGGGESSVPLSH
jgi:hypothetical protein